MKRNILIGLILMLGNITIAGNGIDKDASGSSKIISGKVIDKKSGEEIAGAAVTINDKTYYSDLSGNFMITITTSKAEAVVSFISYSNTKVNIDPFSYSPIVIELESE
jgi:carboxypeptidase-like protein